MNFLLSCSAIGSLAFCRLSAGANGAVDEAQEQIIKVAEIHKGLSIQTGIRNGLLHRNIDRGQQQWTDRVTSADEPQGHRNSKQPIDIVLADFLGRLAEERI